MAEVKLITQAEYAKHRGCSAVAVHKAVKAGRISLIGERIDPKVADIQWEQNTRARARNVRAAAPPASSAATPSQPIVDLVGLAAAEPVPGAASAAASAVPAPDGYNAARARREVADAETAEINLRKLRGEVLVTADVARAGYEIGRDVRDTMESAVNSLAAELAPLATADACAEVLRRHNRAVQDLLAKSFREKIGQLPAGGAA